ncbi:MAG TPA: GLPGLI family protein [Chitinophagaceae bacterium]|nr:GLPGLI family protein [Chitinophagaceae bacterium]MCB9055112.1 GLPGLI family protein [Chitinophagales bacterium]HPG10090.1 GLPGLI family protein [Chitinophagaceae bacterium]HRX93464.1 GLPGLI family protein [Chitinophagaceae bacterium]
MKKILLSAAAFVLLTGIIKAQQTQGKVVYNRTVKLHFSFTGMAGGMESQMPSSRTDKYELTFGNNQSIWRQAEPDNSDDGGPTFGGNGMQIRMVVAGANDVLYNNFNTHKRVEKREFMDKTFIVDDTISSLQWKMAGETKTILGHNCMKATAVRVSKRMSVNMDNGKMERKEIDDTANVVAWFATDIPVSAGPSEFQGQLPGLILEMDIKDGDQTYVASFLDEKADLTTIKEPTGKKRYTQEEYKKERDKMMEEMQRNNPGGNRIIRMN